MALWVKKAESDRVNEVKHRSFIQKAIDAGQLGPNDLIATSLEGPWRPLSEVSWLKFAQEQVFPGEVSFPVENHDSGFEFESPPLTSRVSKVKKQSSPPGKSSSEQAERPCSFPGSLLESLIPSLNDSRDPKIAYFQASQLDLYGIGHAAVFGICSLAVLINAVKLDVPISVLGWRFLGIACAGVAAVVLHFMTNWALRLGEQLRCRPVYVVSSKRHLHMVAAPLFLVAFLTLVAGLVYYYESSWIRSDIMELIPLVVVAVITAGMLFQIRAILNPAQVGVQIDSNVGPAQSVLGTMAVLLRASLYGNRYSYPFALICWLLGAIGLCVATLISLDPETVGELEGQIFELQEEMRFAELERTKQLADEIDEIRETLNQGAELFHISSSLAIYGLFGVLVVVANYLKVFFGLYTVDLVTAFFAIRDNTARTQD